MPSPTYKDEKATKQTEQTAAAEGRKIYSQEEAFGLDQLTEDDLYSAAAYLVRRSDGQTRLEVSELDIWAEPLGQGARRVLGEVLAARLLPRGIDVIAAGDRQGSFISVDRPHLSWP